jgi:hypothetical protein
MYFAGFPGSFDVADTNLTIILSLGMETSITRLGRKLEM